MHNPKPGAVFVGIDVSAREIAVALQTDDQLEPVRTFANTASGHQQLGRYLRRDQQPVRVCVEASGNYSLDLCLALHAIEGIELSVIMQSPCGPSLRRSHGQIYQLYRGPHRRLGAFTALASVRKRLEALPG